MTSPGRLALILVLASATRVAADDEPSEPPPAEPAPAPEPAPTPELDPALVARLRALYDQHDYVGVRRELAAAHRATGNPQLLFALGQVELQLRHYQAAIDHYERFIATHPPRDQIDLAQQAIGAARIQLANQPPRRHRHWQLADTLISIGGGLAIAGGAGLVAYGHRESLDRDGTLTDYAARVDRARTLQWTGAGLGAAGVLAIAIAIVRWRLRPEDGYEIVAAGGDGAGASAEWRW